MLDKLYKLSEEIVNIAIKKKLKIATAESFTGGLIVKSLTDIPGSSNAIVCGLVTYQINSKVKILGINEYKINQYGVVSKEIVLDMSEHALNLSKADISISSTGYAGPNDGDNNGNVFLGIAYRTNDGIKKIYGNYHLKYTRDMNRQLATYIALKKVKEIITKI